MFSARTATHRGAQIVTGRRGCDVQVTIDAPIPANTFAVNDDVKAKASPIGSGVGLTPTGKCRLVTAHTRGGLSFRAENQQYLGRSCDS
jgi:hypothetical protein